VETYEESPRVLADRFALQQALDERDRVGGFTMLLEQRRESFEGGEVALAKPVAVVGDPLVVACLEEISSVYLDSVA
jgi:hypothetical protein